MAFWRYKHGTTLVMGPTGPAVLVAGGRTEYLGFNIAFTNKTAELYVEKAPNGQPCGAGDCASAYAAWNG